jgi:cell division protein FtsW
MLARLFAGADRYVAWILLVLAAVGTVAVYSAVAFLAQTKGDGDVDRLLVLHLVRLAVAGGALVFFTVFDYHRWAKLSKPVLILTWVLLALVPVVGVFSGGAARWLRVGAFGFQPSEIARLALLTYLPVLITRKQAYIGEFRRAFVPLAFWIVVTCALIGMQNLSTALVLLLTCGVVLFVGRVRMTHLAGVAAVGLAGALVMLSLYPARAARVEGYLGVKLFPHTAHVQLDAQGENYQAHQAEIAFARGGLVGVGPGKSIQKDFLPAPYNDFIFAIVGEEYGLLGALLVLGLFVALLFRGYLRIARHAPDPLGLLLAVAMTTSLVLYAFVHAGVASGLLPVTGLPLPLVSYGGSSLITTGAMAGVLLNVSRRSAAAPDER